MSKPALDCIKAGWSCTDQLAVGFSKQVLLCKMSAFRGHECNSKARRGGHDMMK